MKIPFIVMGIVGTLLLAACGIVNRTAPQVGRTSLSKNRGAQLPCWLTICPGRTDWTTAAGLFNHLDQRILSENRGSAASFVVELGVQEAEGANSLEYSAPRYTVADGVVQVIDVHPTFGPDYPIRALLSDHGSPDEILVRLDQVSIPETYWFTLVIIYGRQGIAAAYRQPAHLDKTGNRIDTCMGPVDLSRLVLWDPQSNQSYNEVISQSTLAVSDYPYLPIREAMGVHTSAFFASMTRMSGGGCMTSPTDLWP